MIAPIETHSKQIQDLAIKFTSKIPYNYICAAITENGVIIQTIGPQDASLPVFLSIGPNQTLQLAAFHKIQNIISQVGSIQVPYSELTPGRVIQLIPAKNNAAS